MLMEFLIWQPVAELDRGERLGTAAGDVRAGVRGVRDLGAAQERAAAVDPRVTPRTGPRQHVRRCRDGDQEAGDGRGLAERLRQHQRLQHRAQPPAASARPEPETGRPIHSDAAGKQRGPGLLGHGRALVGLGGIHQPEPGHRAQGSWGQVAPSFQILGQGFGWA